MGERFDKVANHFESHSRLSSSEEFHEQEKRCLVFLRYEGRAAVLASCAKCERKFLHADHIVTRRDCAAEIPVILITHVLRLGKMAGR